MIIWNGNLEAGKTSSVPCVASKNVHLLVINASHFSRIVILNNAGRQCYSRNSKKLIILKSLENTIVQKADKAKWKKICIYSIPSLYPEDKKRRSLCFFFCIGNSKSSLEEYFTLNILLRKKTDFNNNCWLSGINEKQYLLKVILPNESTKLQLNISDILIKECWHLNWIWVEKISNFYLRYKPKFLRCR